MDYIFRIEQLIKLKKTIIKYENDILNALNIDLNKSKEEAYMTEIALVYDEIEYFIKNLKKLMKKRKVSTSLSHFFSNSYYILQPYGKVLIISPWNYPFQLSFIPLIGAIAAGNKVVLKPSEYSVETSNIIKKIINEIFDKEYIEVELGNEEKAKYLLEQKFDYIFFTGNAKIGKEVMQKAAKNLIPITLELGGKSPCIVSDDAKIKLAAKRIIWGKCINSGQTCVAPDYVYVHKDKKEEFIKYCKEYIEKFFSKDAINNVEYPKIITSRHYFRLVELLKDNNILFGGKYDDNYCKIEPTLIECDNWDNKCMSNEIFGPILPILTYNNIEDVIKEINKRDNPLSCYIFSENINFIENIIKNLKFGGGCINDTIIHVSNHKLPFGGIGASGMGRYHGEASFETFSYKKSILRKTTIFDFNIRYAPYKNKFNLLKKLMKWF